MKPAASHKPMQHSCLAPGTAVTSLKQLKNFQKCIHTAAKTSHHLLSDGYCHPAALFFLKQLLTWQKGFLIDIYKVLLTGH